MLKGLQLVGICMSMVNPTNFYYENKKQAQYTTRVEVTDQTDITLDETDNADYKAYKKKYKGSGQSDQLLVYASVYTNSYYENGTTWWGNIYTNVQRNQNSMLTVLQLTPYRFTNNNVMDVNFNVRLRIAIPDVPMSYTMYTKIYTSTEEYWRTYVDTTLSNDPYQNYNIIQDITNPQRGFLYTEETDSQVVTEQNTDQFRELVRENIYLDPLNTNYMYIYSYMLYDINPGQATGHVTRRSVKEAFWPLPNVVNITGNEIPTITGYEVVDIPGIMFDVLTMPFTFISVAFNLTIFPNTPYQVNISNLFLSIIAILVFLAIIRKILGR